MSQPERNRNEQQHPPQGSSLAYARCATLSLIGFGFTIFQFFEKLREGNVITGSAHPARNFGIALVALGIVMLIGGIGFHTSFMIELRKQRARMRNDELIHAETSFPISLTLMTALLLLVLGLATIVAMLFHAGPLG